jgi:pimeloyl-ACP methyl ester carboxylesterase
MPACQSLTPPAYRSTTTWPAADHRWSCCTGSSGTQPSGGTPATWTRSPGQFTLVLVDARGRGRSGKPHDPAMYATQRLAADVLAVLDDLGVDRAGIWGQSLGGRAGLILAIHHPGRLRALVAGATRAQAVTVDPATIEAEVRSFREHGMAGVVADLEAAGPPLPAWLRSVILSPAR